MLRGVSDPPEGSKMPAFPFRPRLVCSSWKVSSMNFARTEFSEVRCFLVFLAFCFVLCPSAHTLPSNKSTLCSLRGQLDRRVKAQDSYLLSS